MVTITARYRLVRLVTETFWDMLSKRIGVETDFFFYFLLGISSGICMCAFACLCSVKNFLDMYSMVQRVVHKNSLYISCFT